MSSAQYYALPADNLKTWPVYLPGREPEEYQQMLERVGPQPMIEPERLKTEADWIQASRTVFEQTDHLHRRTRDPAVLDIVRRGESLVRISHQLSAAACDKAMVTSLRLLAVLNIRFKYASARRALHVSYPRPSHALRNET